MSKTNHQGVPGTSLAVQWLKSHVSHSRGAGLIPGQGIPHTMQCSKKKKKKGKKKDVSKYGLIRSQGSGDKQA